MARVKSNTEFDGTENNTTEAVSGDERHVSVEPVVYCGPNLPRANIRSMDIFRGGLPGHVASFFEKHPEARRLTIPVSKLNETRRRTETPGTEENRLYQVLLASRGEMEHGV